MSGQIFSPQPHHHHHLPQYHSITTSTSPSNITWGLLQVVSWRDPESSLQNLPGWGPLPRSSVPAAKWERYNLSLSVFLGALPRKPCAVLQACPEMPTGLGRWTLACPFLNICFVFNICLSVRFIYLFFDICLPVGFCIFAFLCFWYLLACPWLTSFALSQLKFVHKTYSFILTRGSSFLEYIDHKG